jgi:predicted PurR-regulated permease PerM
LRSVAPELFSFHATREAGHPRPRAARPFALFGEPAMTGNRRSEDPAPPTGNEWGAPNQVHALALIAATAVGIYLCYLMTAPLLPALAAALALAVLFVPLHRWVLSKVRRPNLAAGISLVVVAIVVVVPVTLVTERIVGEAARGAETVKAMVDSGDWRRAFDAHPLAPAGRWIEKHVDLPGLIQSVASWLTSTGAALVRGSVVQLVGVVLTFYMLFYFLRDWRAALDGVRALSPLSAADIGRLFDDVFDTVHATVYGTFVVAIVQGALGGLMFWWLGLPAPLLWGLVMGLLAVVPVLGAFIIWIPAALFLFATGSEGKALVLALWGTIVVGGIDNVLYPLLVGNSLKMHTIIAFVSIVGGMIFFGAAGLILGPIVFTVTRVLLQIWRGRNAVADA